MFGLFKKKEIPHTHMWGEIDESGRQYCLVCNIAQHVKKECQHRYVIIDKYKIHEEDRVASIIYVSRCELCGKIIKEEI